MKRHNHEEILSKLRHASQLESRGQSQAEICKALGISIMTLHRWRKEATSAGVDLSAFPTNDVLPQDTKDTVARQIDDLKLENTRLRRIISDLMLEKLKVEEVAAASGQRKAVP